MKNQSNTSHNASALLPSSSVKPLLCIYTASVLGLVVHFKASVLLLLIKLYIKESKNISIKMLKDVGMTVPKVEK